MCLTGYKILLIYEISVKNFTSPIGSGTGTFKSIMQFGFQSIIGQMKIIFMGFGHKYVTMHPG